MKRISFVCLMLSMLTAVPVSAQKKVSVDLGGFVAVQSCYDSRVSSQGAGDLLYMYPKDKVYDTEGKDINERGHANYFANMARFIARINGPQLFGAASRGYVEIEVSGYNGSAAASNPILYRHAYVALDWENSSLTLGQTWHPTNEMFPGVVDIAIGAPFNSLNRSPMLKYDRFLGDDRSLKLTGAAIFQAMYCSNGPQGRSSDYAKNSMVPNFWLGAEQTLGDLKLTIGGEFQRIAPVFNGNDKKYLNTFDGMVQAVYAHDKFTAKGKVLYGENMSHLGLVTGYGLKADGEYSPLTAMSSFVFLSYGSSLKGGLMCGYMKNLGAKDDLVDIYSLEKNLDGMYRIAPSIQYVTGNVNLGLEWDMTTAAYGDIEAKGTVTNTHEVTNHRILASLMYTF